MKRIALALLGAIIGFAVLTVLYERRARSLDLSRVDPSARPHSVPSSATSRDKAVARAEYEFRRLRDPRTGTIPPDVRARDLAFSAKLPRVEDRLAKTSRSSLGLWSFRGPMNVGGRTRALAIDMDFDGSSNQRILAGGVSGGMYLSEDDGNTWRLVTDLQEHASVTTVAQDPTRRNVWYYGTGETNGNSAGGHGADYAGTGIFKSVDSGNSWTLIPSTVQGSVHGYDSAFDAIWKIAVSPTTGTVFVAVRGSLLASYDGGTSWITLLAGSPFSGYSDVHVASDGDVYAALSRHGSGHNLFGIFYAVDESDTFTDISPRGLVPDPHRIVISSSASDPSTVYALVQKNESGDRASDHQFFRYDEITDTWTNLSSQLPNFSGLESNASLSTQGGYDQLVAVHPTNSSIVYIGGTNLYRSKDRGLNFVRIGGYAGNQTYASWEGHHPDQHALVFYPNNPMRALSGSDGGVARSEDILAPQHVWAPTNSGYITSQFYGVGIDPVAGGEMVVGGLQDNGSWASDDPNPHVDWTSVFDADGGYSHVAPGATSIYMSNQFGGLFRLTYPSTYTLLTPASANAFQFIAPSELDPADPRVMYLAEAGGIWRNPNLDDVPQGGIASNWTFLGQSAQDSHETISLAVSRNPSNRIYFGTTDFRGSSRIIRVDDAAGDGPGIDVSPAILRLGAAPFPAGFGINPDDGDEVVAVFSNYGVESIWHTTDAGATWTNVGGNLGGKDGPSIRTAVIVPFAGEKVVLVGTSVGVYSTLLLNGANTVWEMEGSDEIGNVVVNQLVARHADATVVAATHGRGIFQANLMSVDTEQYGIAPDFELHPAYPNPFSDATAIPIALKQSGHVRISVFDMTGREVRRLTDGFRASGRNEVLWDGRDRSGRRVAAGTYLVQIASTSETRSDFVVRGSRKITLLR